MGFAAQNSAGDPYPTERARLAPWLETELSKMRENVPFFITQQYQWWRLKKGDASSLLSLSVLARSPHFRGPWLTSGII